MPEELDLGITFNDCPAPLTTERDIFRAWLAAPKDPATNAFYRLARTILTERNAYRDALLRATSLMHDDRPRRDS